MKISKLLIALLFAILTFFAHGTFLGNHQGSPTGKFIDDCIQWGIDRLKANYDTDPAKNIVPTYNLTSLVVNYTFEMGQGGPCPENFFVNVTAYCPFVGDNNQLLYVHEKRTYP